MTSKLLIPLVCAVTFLSGCSDESSQVAEQQVPATKPFEEMTEAERIKEKSRRIFNPTPEEREADRAAEEARRQATDPITWELAEPKQHPSLDTYLPLEWGTQLVFLYNALRDTRDDSFTIGDGYRYNHRNLSAQGYDELGELLAKLSATTNQFERNDLLPALDEQFDKHIAAHRGLRHVKVELPARDVIAAYDFDKKGFATQTTLLVPVRTEPTTSAEMRRMASGQGMPAPDRSNIRWDDNGRYQLNFSNGPEFNFFEVEDESAARVLEEVIAKKQGYNLVFYGYIDSLTQGKDKQSDDYRVVTVHLQRFDVVDSNDADRILASQTK